MESKEKYCFDCNGRGGRWDDESIDQWYACEKCQYLRVLVNLGSKKEKQITPPPRDSGGGFFMKGEREMRDDTKKIDIGSVCQCGGKIFADGETSAVLFKCDKCKWTLYRDFSSEDIFEIMLSVASKELVDRNWMTKPTRQII